MRRHRAYRQGPAGRAARRRRAHRAAQEATARRRRLVKAFRLIDAAAAEGRVLDFSTLVGLLNPAFAGTEEA